ncbi:hypothetical protein ABZ330_10530 [Streptomyces sp. NPDC006172]|uniref:hypothetical protein n=1 Tax=Streptomyces sp. NPDC006172 TaxID=3154470 RepID=UPI0033C6A3D2
MLVHHAEPALAAAAATGVILAARFAATRPYTRRRAVGTARRVGWRTAASLRTPTRHDRPAARPHPGPTSPARPHVGAPAPASTRRPHAPAASPRAASAGAKTPRREVSPAEAAVWEAEQHVHRCWQRLRAHSDRREA